MSHPPSVEARSGIEFTLSKAAYTLRILLLLAGLVALVILVSGGQAAFFNVTSSPSPVAIRYKFSYSPSFIYLVIALTMTCIYSLVTASLYYRSLSKPTLSSSYLMRFILFDMLMLVLVASANGAGASIAYLGSKGDSHVGWTKMCRYYGKFCMHVQFSLIASVIGSVIFAVLLLISMYTVYRRLKNSAANSDQLPLSFGASRV